MIKRVGTTELLSENFSNSKKVMINNRHQAKPARIFTDVKEGDDMWVKIKSHQTVQGGTHTLVDDIEIHIHSPRDIGGAGWNHGKFGSGQTTVIE